MLIDDRLAAFASFQDRVPGKVGFATLRGNARIGIVTRNVRLQSF
jgi:hypothetical protein